jgi:ribosome-binding ATPase YchF (GTP1/OBG family)
VAAAALGLELELSKMPEGERESFAAELGLSTASSRDALIKTILDISGQMIFFTAGDKEVRTWLLHKGGTALEAAAGIHNDLARGFIRAEVMTCSDLVRLGSEREIKANNLMRQEHKEYVVKDDDILHIRHNA